MKINTTNKDKLNAAIDKAEGTKVSARMVDAGNITRMINEIEGKLSWLMFKKDWQGLTFHLDYHAQSFPGAYKGRPESTQVQIERGSNAWFATHIRRNYTHGPGERIIPFGITGKSGDIMAHVSQSRYWS
jgi:hypothetical protein